MPLVKVDYLDISEAGVETILFVLYTGFSFDDLICAASRENGILPMQKVGADELRSCISAPLFSLHE